MEELKQQVDLGGSDQNRVILRLTPQTNFRTTQNYAMLFRIPEECPVNCGLPRRSAKKKDNLPLVDVKTMAKKYPELWEALGGENWKNRMKKKEVRYGCPHCLSSEALAKKRRIEQYNQYKDDLRALATKAGFEMPVAGWSWYFYIPMPKSWTGKKKNMMMGQHHCQTPDLNNLEKAAEDALSVSDERVAQRSGHGKFWIGSEEQGFIEIFLNQPIFNPFNVTFIDQEAINKAPKRKWIKREAGDPAKRKPKAKPVKLDPKFLKKDKIK